MASEVAFLPSSVLKNVNTFTANTTAGSLTVTGIADVTNLGEGMLVSGNGISPGTAIDSVGQYSITLSEEAKQTLTGVNLTAGVSSYFVDSIYSSIPQFAQDGDAQASPVSYPLYKFIWGMGSIVENQINSLVQSATGRFGTFDRNYIDAPGWSQALDIDRCPEFALPWLAQFVGVSSESFGELNLAQKKDKIINRSGFKRGTLNILISALVTEINYKLAGVTSVAPINVGQVVVMEQTALSKVNFLGNTTTGNTITGITSTAGLANGMYVYGEGIPGNTTITNVATNTITLSHDSASAQNGEPFFATTGKEYTPDQYSIVILMPTIYFNNYTYATLAAELSGTSSVTYTTIDAEINALGANGYQNLFLDAVPKSNSAFAPFIYKYRPAGVQVYVGGY
jgi:hypothetical protein